MKVLAIFAHMDDETILSYGTLRKLRDMGYTTELYTLCGLGRTNSDNQKDRISAYQKITSKLVDKVSTEKVHDLTLTEDFTNKVIIDKITTFKPNIVITHSGGDLHFEHRLIYNSTLLACRLHTSQYVKALYSAMATTETWSHNSYKPLNINQFFDISRYLSAKRDALNKYKQNELNFQRFDNRSVDSIINKNKMYGFTCGVEACEAYEQIFSVF